MGPSSVFMPSKSETNFNTQEEGANLEKEGGEISRKPPATNSLDENKESCQQNESGSRDSVLIVGEEDIIMDDTPSTQDKTLKDSDPVPGPSHAQIVPNNILSSRSPQYDMPSATPRMLMQFEAIFLTETQRECFIQLYNERKFDVPNPVFQSWLPLKLASLPTESAALQAVLVARTPTDIPKKTAKRAGRKVPEGAARFDPLSPEWKIIMETKDQS